MIAGISGFTARLPQARRGKPRVSAFTSAKIDRDRIAAVRHGKLHEVKSPLVVQPGPAALTEGLSALHRIVAWAWRTH